MDDFLDRCHRITGRETLAHSRADQQVAFLDVGGIGHVAQFQAFRVAGTAGDGAQAVAVHLHRNAVGGIGQQQHAGGVGHYLDHLAHQSAGVEHGLAEEHTVLLALVDQDAVGEGVGIDADQLAHQDLLVHQGGGVEQFAQAHVLLGEGRQLLQAALHQQGLGLELLVLGDQGAAAGELVADAVPDAHRQVSQPIEGREDQAHLAAHGLEGIEAGVDHHQRSRKHGEHQQAHAERRSLGK
ncbi:hypothetical protein D9M70_459440 [compost metagenome]